MKVIVCGAGQVGWQIARHLASENNDVTVVDNNAALVRRITDSLDVGGITGFASHPDVLERAGARDADMIIAATFSDEVNMIACQVAHSVFTVPRKIARVRAQSYLDPEWSDIYRQDHMPIDVIISPEKEVAEAALRRLSAPAAFEINGFLDDSVQLLGLTLGADCPVLNTPLRQLTELFSTLRAYVVAIRSENQKLRIADSDDQLFAGDQIYLFAAKEDVDRTLQIFGKQASAGNRALILGAGNVGLAVAKVLESQGKRTRLKVIERDRARAEFAADSLERTIVLHGDGLNKDILEEAGIDAVDSFLAVTDDDKTNLLSCARAKSLGAKLTVCLINDPSLAPLMRPLGIDAYINQFDPAARAPWPNSRRLFRRRCRGGGDRGAGSGHLRHCGQAGPRHAPARRGDHRGDPEGAGACHTPGRDRHFRRGQRHDILHGGTGAAGGATVPRFSRFLLG